MKRTFILSAITVIFLVACQTAHENSELPTGTKSVVHDITAETPVSRPTPTPDSDVLEIAVEPALDEQEQVLALKEITIEADDYGFYPSNTITAEKGQKLRVTFKVRTKNVYYEGLQIRGKLFDTGKVKPGGLSTVEFTADLDSTFASYWPSSGVKKADGQIDVT